MVYKIKFLKKIIGLQYNTTFGVFARIYFAKHGGIIATR